MFTRLKLKRAKREQTIRRSKRQGSGGGGIAYFRRYRGNIVFSLCRDGGYVNVTATFIDLNAANIVRSKNEGDREREKQSSHAYTRYTNTPRQMRLCVKESFQVRVTTATASATGHALQNAVCTYVNATVKSIRVLLRVLYT